MKYSRQEHYLFLEEELRAQSDQFKQKLDSSASYLLNVREEIFISQFIKIENGEMMLRMSTSRGIPRKGEYLYCFTTPKHLHNFKEWGNKTYGELLKEKGYATEVVCIWQSQLRDDPKHCLVAFRGVDLEFAEHIEGHYEAFLILGPNIPPLQYISNLQNIVRECTHTQVENLIEGDIQPTNEEPTSLDSKVDVSSFIINQLNLTDDIILQGPPGTGKTYQIASICKELCQQGASVLVTALTNRALMEVASKEMLKDMLEAGQVHKTKLSVDEAKELPKLKNAPTIAVLPGQITLSTFYITSGEAQTVSRPQFDYVIMDEASQALLGMIIGVKLLGKKCLFVGDTNQLPPVISINEDRIDRKNYHFYVNGLNSLDSFGTVPSYRLSNTYRLTNRAADFTGIFYNGTLKSKSELKPPFNFDDLLDSISILFHPQGGPTLLKTDLKLGDKKPAPALSLATLLVSALLGRKEKLHVSVLTFYIETTKALQRTIYQTIGNHDNLLIETVSRVQGLTTDIAIYVIPNTSYYRSLDRRLFNVATSRSTRHTIIISDVNILHYQTKIDADVTQYLEKLNEEAFYIPIKTQNGVPLDEANNEEKTPQQEESTITIENDQIPTRLPICVENKDKTNHIEDTEDLQADETNSNFIATKIPKVEVRVIGKIDLSKFETKKKKASPQPSAKTTTYVIDTNVFVDCPNIIGMIDKKSTIVLTAKVVDELDKLKLTLDSSGKISVQQALKNINSEMDRRDIQFEVANTRLLPRDFDYRSPDNMILSVALKYKEDNPTLLTSDNGLQVKAKGLKISTITLKEFLKR